MICASISPLRRLAVIPSSAAAHAQGLHVPAYALKLVILSHLQLELGSAPGVGGAWKNPICLHTPLSVSAHYMLPPMQSSGACFSDYEPYGLGLRASRAWPDTPTCRRASPHCDGCTRSRLRGPRYTDMPQWRLMENLALAEEQVALGAKHVARQREIIAEYGTVTTRRRRSPCWRISSSCRPCT